MDDDLDARLIYRHYLTVMGCQVYTARDGLIGVELAKRRKPDVIVLDLSMPRLNGWAAAAELKRSPATRTIPIIVLSALPSSRGEAQAAGCDGFLAKPCLPELLWLEIRLLLDSGAASELHFAGERTDSVRICFTCRGSQVTPSVIQQRQESGILSATAFAAAIGTASSSPMLPDPAPEHQADEDRHGIHLPRGSSARASGHCLRRRHHKAEAPTAAAIPSDPNCTNAASAEPMTTSVGPRRNSMEDR